MTILSTFSTWPAIRWPWFLLAGSALLLEFIALNFQYIMGLEPCVMCVYQRAAVAGIMISALPAMIAPKLIVARILSYVIWLTSSIWGLIIAFEHVQMQNPENFMLAMSCDVYPNFPSWFAIHQWFPNIFEARGTCGDIDWIFLGYSMPQWMVVCFSLYTLLAVIIIGNRLIHSKKL